tara:strand:+ start:1622 stop:2185 length:564 start_codon:yes stop_codon:yes gene_type:complete
MTYVECAGGQDRDTTTSETRPYIPPSKTKNCYSKDKFDRDKCGSSNEEFCQGDILGENRNMELGATCVPDNHGGYCKDDTSYYIARGDGFIPLTKEMILDRYKSSSNNIDTEVDTKRELREQEKRFTNRIRELQIMGKDPINKKQEDSTNKEVHSSISSILYNIGIGFILIIFLISLSVVLVQKQII